jgi:hypothetical protein
MPRTRVEAILEQTSSYERLVDERGTTGDQILAALRRHSTEFELADVGAVVELALEIADELDRKPAVPGFRRAAVLHALESIANSVASGFTLETSPLIAIQLRRALRLVEADESWPDWLLTE